MCVAFSNWPIHSLWEGHVLCQVPLQQGWIQDFTYSEGSFEGPRGPTSACAGALLPSFTEQQNIFPVFHIGSLKQLFLLNNTAAHQPTALLLQLQNTPETYLNQDRQRHLYCWMINVPCLNLSPSLVSETSPIMSSVVFFLPWVFIFLAKCICSSKTLYFPPFVLYVPYFTRITPPSSMISNSFISVCWRIFSSKFQTCLHLPIT